MIPNPHLLAKSHSLTLDIHSNPDHVIQEPVCIVVTLPYPKLHIKRNLSVLTNLL